MADEIRRLIRVRTDKGARFKRDGFGKKPQLADSWRKPRGQHNKQREQKKAKGALPKPGFGSPVAVRGMHPSGFFEILVYKIDDLEGLNPKTQAIRIAGTVGGRKRAVIQEKALTAGLRVLNAKAAAPEKKPEQKAAEDKKKAGKQEPVKEKGKAEKKEKKSAPAKEAKPAAAKKKEAPEEKKSPAKKENQAAKPEPADTKKAEEQKPKAKKPAEKSAAKAKPKKESQVKEETSAETKTAKKAAVRPKKKPAKEGEEQ